MNIMEHLGYVTLGWICGAIIAWILLLLKQKYDIRKRAEEYFKETDL